MSPSPVGGSEKLEPSGLPARSASLWRARNWHRGVRCEGKAAAACRIASPRRESRTSSDSETTAAAITCASLSEQPGSGSESRVDPRSTGARANEIAHEH